MSENENHGSRFLKGLPIANHVPSTRRQFIHLPTFVSNMDFQRFGVSLRKRSSNNALTKRSQTTSPIPQVPIVHIDKPPSRSTKQRGKPNVMFASMSDFKDRALSGNSASMPTSPTFDSEEETSVGEPLIQDIATRSIPKEYKPFTSRSPERTERPSEEFSIQHTFPPLSSEDEEDLISAPGLPRYNAQRFARKESTKDTKRDTSIYVPTRTR
jgi:hypothetical protein